jgi:hypothetical protein
LSFCVHGIHPDRWRQIEEAIRRLFPEWPEDEWWWQYYQHERTLVGEIDGRSFEEQTCYVEGAEDTGIETTLAAVTAIPVGTARYRYRKSIIALDEKGLYR